MFSPIDISVIIPSYNSRHTISACLASLLAQEVAPREIIVVDSSTDGTSQLIARDFPGVQVHTVKRRLFPGPARNLGISMACGQILAFLDADCTAQPDWLRRIAAGHDQGHQVVGGAVLLGNPNSGVAWAGYLGEFREFLPAGRPRYVLHLPTCNISYRRSLFSGSPGTGGAAMGSAGTVSDVRGFPSAYYPQEDLLFNYMLIRQGVRIWFDPEIRVRHICRQELRAFLSHQHRIGRVTRSTLNRIRLPGSSLARHGWLALLSAPALGSIKFMRTAALLPVHFPRQVMRRPELLPLLALGSLWWARGFAAGARRGLSGISDGRHDPDEPIFSWIMPVSGDK